MSERKRCLRCKQRKSIDCFGICRSRDDGRNGYCKPCVLVMVHAHRERKREMKRLVELTLAQRPPERKPLRVSVPPEMKVQNAIREGFTTRDEIKQRTGLKWDQLGDILLNLTYESNTLRIVRSREGKRIFQFREAVNSERIAA
jgi:hypothetical protein